MRIVFFVLFVGVVDVALGQKRSISEVEILGNMPDRVHFGKQNVSLRFVNGRVLSTPNPSVEAVALYRYLQDMSGKLMLSGQMWVPWGIHEIEYIQTKTGYKPAIAGFDYINEPSNALETQRAIDYWRGGGIVTFMWHAGAPGIGEGYENSKATIDIDRCFIEGTEEYEDFWGDLKRIGDWLQKLEDANVPVIWRPFHELDGHWFWWSKQGPERFKLLWTTMYDYLVNERGLSNLIWTLCYTATPDSSWYPGDDYVDIAGADTYDNLDDSHAGMYHAVVEAVGQADFPIAFHETGNLPQPEECIVDGAMWSWWMVWHTDWLTQVDEDYLKYNYQHHLVVTHDELPDIVSEYGWDAACEVPEIQAYVKIGDGDWEESNRIALNVGEQVSFRVATDDAGSWDWNGYGTSTADQSQLEQTVTMDKLGVAKATFTSTCGVTYTQTFHVTNALPNQPVLSINSMPMVYPTEMYDHVTVAGEKPVDFILLDARGVEVLSIQVKEQRQVDVSHLISGSYFAVLRGASNRVVRLIKK
ncbi:glycosyl hydrolase [Marinoscillum furvescens]|uniref:Glycosyl hydrolase family 26 n=1 Tax=Marinoscillum furvescens DSM 4134 TaxID=1122208 RepID=A0A3D9KZQ3_MARFU|nr:glycosyl hydrolase [Marinoscillum furvescens]RED96128.1 glycosyl hydrolase family 26 [Marinoscillum furvescens DSM 4134]